MIVRSKYGLVDIGIETRGPQIHYGDLVRGQYGDLVDMSVDTTSPLAIAIYTAGGILLLGLGVYALNRRRT
jgi:hypothetical protein